MRQADTNQSYSRRAEQPRFGCSTALLIIGLAPTIPLPVGEVERMSSLAFLVVYTPAAPSPQVNLTDYDDGDGDEEEVQVPNIPTDRAVSNRP